jgi:branched-chain amino acid transport system permease protein
MSGGAGSLVAQHLIDAVAYGSIFALLSLSLSLLYGVMGLMNFAFGELIMVGAYSMFYSRSLPWPIMVIICIVMVIILSLTTNVVAFRPLRNASPTSLLVTSFALSYLLQQIAWMTVGRGTNKGVRPFAWLQTQHQFGGIRLSNLDVVTAAVTVILLVAMTWLMRSTSLGAQLRASTEDFEFSRVLGVRADRVIALAFGITGMLAGAAAVLYVLRVGSVTPDMGQGPLLVAFVGSVIGGLGSMASAAVGGFLLGGLLDISSAVLPSSIGKYSQALAFGLVILILIVQPEGLAQTSRKLKTISGGALRGNRRATGTAQRRWDEADEEASVS